MKYWRGVSIVVLVWLATCLPMLLLRPAHAGQLAKDGAKPSLQSPEQCPECVKGIDSAQIESLNASVNQVVEQRKVASEIVTGLSPESCSSGVMPLPRYSAPQSSWSREERVEDATFLFRIGLDDSAAPLQALPPGMTKLQRNLIVMYTGTAYAPINQTVAGQKGSHQRRWLPVARELNAALRKLPPYIGPSRRNSGGDAKSLASLKPKQAFRFGYFASSSSDLGFSRLGSVAFVISSRTGRDISKLSMFPSEKEVLFAPESEFRVLKTDPAKRLVYLQDVTESTELYRLIDALKAVGQDYDALLRDGEESLVFRQYEEGDLSEPDLAVMSLLAKEPSVAISAFPELPKKAISAAIEAASNRLKSCSGVVEVSGECLSEALKTAQPGSIIDVPSSCPVMGSALPDESKAEPSASIRVVTKSGIPLRGFRHWSRVEREKKPPVLIRPGTRLKVIQRPQGEAAGWILEET